MPTNSILVIGGGPAGLRAAEVARVAGANVTVCDAQRSVGRKFLIAGRGGLNLTHGEPVENFPARYVDEPERWRDLAARVRSRQLTEVGDGPRSGNLRRDKRTRLSAWTEGRDTAAPVGSTLAGKRRAVPNGGAADES